LDREGANLKAGQDVLKGEGLWEQIMTKVGTVEREKGKNARRNNPLKKIRPEQSQTMP